MTQQNHMPIFRVLRLVRDARSTKKADRELLYALVLRCNPKRQFIAWPSYSQLAVDTLLDEATLKRAAKRLEDAGLIKRVVRANRSNHFFINVARLQEQAAKMSADDALKAEADEVVQASPFEAPALDEDTNDPVTVSPAEAAVLDALEAAPAQKDYSRRKKEEVPDELIAMLFDHFGDHPSLIIPTAKKIAAVCISKCLAAANGDTALCALTLLWNFANLKTKLSLSKKDKLCGYISSVFPGWMTSVQAEFDAWIDDLCETQILLFEPEAVSYVLPTERYIRSVIGTHLISLTRSTDGLTLTAEITPEYKDSRRLHRTSSQR